MINNVVETKINKHFNNINNIPVAQQISKLTTATLKADSGASKHFVTSRDKPILSHVSKSTSTAVVLPNRTALASNTVGTLNLHPNISAKASQAHILPGLTNSSLLSIGQLCDDGCIAIFHKLHLNIYKNAQLVLYGMRNFKDGLWDVKLPTHTPATNQLQNNQLVANAIIRQDQTKTELANYLHACAFSPALPTLQKAVSNNNFVTWPAIKSINFNKFVTNKMAMYLGHLDQVRTNLQSTKDKPNLMDDFFPPTSTLYHKTYETLLQIIAFSPREFSYGDITGAFPFKSSRGNQYLYILYDFDSNAILVEPMKSR